MNQEPRVQLSLLQSHLNYITNLLGTGNLRYVDTAPILADISQQIQAQQQPTSPPPKANGLGVEDAKVMQ